MSVWKGLSSTSSQDTTWAQLEAKQHPVLERRCGNRASLCLRVTNEHRHSGEPLDSVSEN